MTAPSLGRWTKPTLEGDLVVLRAFTTGDVDAMWEMVRDPEGQELTATTETFTYEQISAWYRSRAGAPDRLDLAIVERATNEVAGEAVLNDYDRSSNSANFRISLRGPRWFGRGLGTQATRLIVDHGLTTIGLASITLTVLRQNTRARRVYEKIGFRTVAEYEEGGRKWMAMHITR